MGELQSFVGPTPPSAGQSRLGFLFPRPRESHVRLREPNSEILTGSCDPERGVQRRPSGSAAAGPEVEGAMEDVIATEEGLLFAVFVLSLPFFLIRSGCSSSSHPAQLRPNSAGLPPRKQRAMPVRMC